MNRIEGLVIRFGTNRRFARALRLSIYVLSALAIASFVAKNAGFTRAELARIVGPGGSFSVRDLFAQRHYYLHRMFEPLAGENAVPPALVTEGISLARANQLRKINLSPSFWANDHLRLRFGEALYPIRLERGDASTAILFAADEQPALGCQLLDQRPLVRLMKCS